MDPIKDTTTLTIKSGFNDAFNNSRIIQNTINANTVYDNKTNTTMNILYGFIISYVDIFNLSVSSGTITLTDGGTNNKIITTTASINVDIRKSGIGGLDTGTFNPSSRFYYIYIINNGTSTNTIFSLSYVSPLLPSGYTYYKRIGSFISTSIGNNSIIKYKELGLYKDKIFYYLNGPDPSPIVSITSGSGTIDLNDATISTSGKAPPFVKSVKAAISYSNTAGLTAQIGVPGGSSIVINAPTFPVYYYTSLPVVNGQITYSMNGTGVFRIYIYGWTENL